MSRWLAHGGLFIAGVVAVAMASCYRLSNPPDLGETVRLEFVGNGSKLVRAQGYFTDAVAKGLVQRLGWRVSPTGTASLQLVLGSEEILAGAQDRRDITNSWTIRIRGTVLLVARGGSLSGTFSGVGNSSGLATTQGEPEALQAAALQAADDLISWLDVNGSSLMPPKPTASNPSH